MIPTLEEIIATATGKVQRATFQGRSSEGVPQRDTAPRGEFRSFLDSLFVTV